MTTPVRIPADVDLHDRVLGPLTVRQLVILAVTGLALYAGWAATRTVLPSPIFLTVAIPTGAAATFLALGQRDGVSMDRMLAAAIRQRLTPLHRVAAPEGVRPAPDWLTAHTTALSTTGGGTNGPDRTPSLARAAISPSPLRLPAEAVTDTGGNVAVLNLGADGLAVIAAASTVNFALRTPTEQESLVGTFGRYLHSLTAPVQILVRTERLDLTEQIGVLRERAGGLPHPALEAAAREHADYLADLGEHTDLLRRQVLLILRERLGPAASVTGLDRPGLLDILTSLTRTRRGGDGVSAGARHAAESRLARRLAEAVDLLAPAGIVLTALDAGQATAVLASACNPDTMLPPSAVLAGADEIITRPRSDTSDPSAQSWWGADSDQDDGPHDDENYGDYDDGDYEDEEFTEERGRL